MRKFLRYCRIVIDLLTTAEVAAKLGVSPSAISQRVKAGSMTPATQLPGLRGAFLFDRDEIEDVA